MFPLFTRTFPTTAAALINLLNESLRRVVYVSGDPVRIRDKSYPALEEIEINLDGASLKESPPRPPSANGKTVPALRADRLTISATPLSVGPARVNLNLAARDLEFHQGRDDSGEIVLTLQSAADGKLEINSDKAELERAIAEVAKQEAGKHGVTIDNVQLELRSLGERAVAAEVHFRARKLFLSASIRIAGQLQIDDDLNAKISGLACSGDGAIASLACNVLGPQLQKIDGRQFPLMALPLGDIRLRDIRLATGERVSIQAEFGSAPI